MSGTGTGRQTRGRQRIPIRRIESQDDLYATFSKRRLGLYKKASELCTLCGVDIGIIIFSPTDIPYSFFSPTMESVIGRYKNPNMPLSSDYARLVEAHSRARIHQCNRRLDEILEEKEAMREREKVLDEIDRTRARGWWEQPTDSLDKEQVTKRIAWWTAFKDKVARRIDEMKNGTGGSSSSSTNLLDRPGSGSGPDSGIFFQNCFSPGAMYGPGPAHGMIGVDEQFPGQFFGSPPPPGGQFPPPAGGSIHFCVPQGIRNPGFTVKPGEADFPGPFRSPTGAHFSFPAGFSTYPYHLTSPGDYDPSGASGSGNGSGEAGPSQ